MNLAAYYSYTGEYNSNSIDRAFDTLPARHQTDVSDMDECRWVSNGESVCRQLFDNAFRSLGSGGAGNNYRLTGSMIRDRNFGIDVTKRFGDIKPETAGIKKPTRGFFYLSTSEPNTFLNELVNLCFSFANQSLSTS